MIIRQVTSSFAGGALDARLHARQDLRAYQNGASALENVVVMPFGGVTGRQGTRWIAKLASSEAPALAVPFEFSTEQTYCLVFLDRAVQIFRDGQRQDVVLGDASGASVLIDATSGTVIGTAGASGGLAFDGVSSALHGACASVTAPALAIGKTFQTLQRIAKAEIWPSSDRGYVDNFGGDLTIELRGTASIDAPSDWGAGDLLGSLVLLDATAGPHVVEAADVSGAYRHVWCRIVHSGTAALHVAEVRFYAALPPISPPWAGYQLRDLYWTQSADTLIVCHPEHAPRRLTRTSHTAWTIAPWAARVKDGVRQSPHYKFAASEATMQASATTGTVTLTARRATGGVLLSWFQAEHVGVRFRVGGKEVEIASVPVSPGPTATATVIETLGDTVETTDWTEEAWSVLRGWPVTCCFFQDRLVFGGSRDLPNRLWMSRAADLDSFELGEADDDDAIELPILTDQVNAIRGVFPGRHLQIFTSGAEFILAGDPIAPSKVSLSRQTRVGSPVDRTVMPIDVDGVTVFIGRRNGMPRQMVWAFEEDAYQAPDLALLSPHLIGAPRGVCYDESKRLIYFVNSDGTIAALTVYRTEEVAAWSRLSIADARVQSVAQVGGETYLVVHCNGQTWLERFEDGLFLDHAITGANEGGANEWGGLSHLIGKTVTATSAGVVVGTVTPDGAGIIRLDSDVTQIIAGLTFLRLIAPLPPVFLQVPERRAGQHWRLVQARFMVHETQSLGVEIGGFVYNLLPQREGQAVERVPSPVSGIAVLRGGRWSDGTDQTPPWRIWQDSPGPLTLLGVEQEIAIVT